MSRPDLWQAPARRHSSGGRRCTTVELLYEHKELTAPSGEVVFSVKNAGAIEHNFVVEDSARKKVAEIPIIEPGTTAEVKAVIKRGAFTIVCTLPGHARAGMVATLSVP